MKNVFKRLSEEDALLLNDSKIITRFIYLTSFNVTIQDRRLTQSNSIRANDIQKRTITENILLNGLKHSLEMDNLADVTFTFVGIDKKIEGA